MSQRCVAICNTKGILKLLEWDLWRSLSHKRFLKCLMEWSLFSSTVYHVRKTLQDLEQVDDVVILF